MSMSTFDDLLSFGVHPQVATARRLDPYWDGVWSSGAIASWMNVNLAKRQVESGLARMPHNLQMTDEQAWEIFTAPNRWRRRLEMLGALASWRTMSAEQLAAHIGAPSVAASSQAIDSAFTLGLIDYGIFTSGLVTTSAKSKARLFRPAASTAFNRRIEPLLSYPERVLVTSGVRYSGGGQFDRHNLLVSEFALRVAEFCDIGTVLGESLSGVDLLAGSGIGLPEITRERKSADATLVRRDGLRIAVEMTASITPYLVEKIRRWVSILASTTLPDSALTLLIIGAPQVDRLGSMSQADFRNYIRKAVTGALRDYPGRAGAQVNLRVGVAMWEDFFPDRGMVDSSFLDLTVDRFDGSRWSKISLLDQDEIPLHPLIDGQFTAVLDAAAATSSPPLWLRRDRKIPPLYRVPLASLGFDPDEASFAYNLDRLSSHPSADEGSIYA